MSTNDATDNQFSNVSPEVINHDSIPAASSSAGGDTPRTFSRQLLSGNTRGVQQFGSPNLFADSGNNYFGVSKNNVQQVLMGLQPTFGEGFYVTKDGIDVSQSTSEDDFIFNSNQDVFKVKKIIPFSGLTFTSITCNAGEVAMSTLNIIFNQKTPFTFIPVVQGSISSGSGSYDPLPFQNTIITDAQRYSVITSQVFASQTQVTLRTTVFISCIGSASTLNVVLTVLPVKIFVLQESAA